MDKDYFRWLLSNRFDRESIEVEMVLDQLRKRSTEESSQTVNKEVSKDTQDIIMKRLNDIMFKLDYLTAILEEHVKV